MNRKIDIFGIGITVLTAKDTMKTAMQYLESETVHAVEIMTLELLMQEKEDEIWREQIQQMDLVLPGEKALFATTELSDRMILKDLENRTFLRMFFRYLKKNKKTIYLLAEGEEELEKMKNFLKGYSHSLVIAGQAVLSPENGSEETVINEINGVEPDCILSGLSSPYGEQFIVRSKALLNARLWIGGILSLARLAEKKPIGKLGAFIRKKIFCYQIEKQKH